MPGWRDNKDWYAVEIKGLKEIRAKLKGPPAGRELFGNPFRKAMANIAKAGQHAGEARGPIGPTGRLVAQLTNRISPAPVPGWAEVRTKARNNGYPYPRRLEYEKKNKRYRWLRNAIESIGGVVEQYLQKAADEIREAWGK